MQVLLRLHYILAESAWATYLFSLCLFFLREKVVITTLLTSTHKIKSIKQEEWSYYSYYLLSLLWDNE